MRSSDSRSTRVVSITSGKGGVGKTTVAVNMGVALARRGHRVLLLDADIGLANIDILLGLRPKYTLEHLFKGLRGIDDIILEGPEGLAVIPATSGVDTLSSLSTERRMILMDSLERVSSHYDYLIVDTGAGVYDDVLYFNSASGEIIVVVSPEPTSLTDAYALIKLLTREYGEREFYLLVNNVSGEGEARQTYRALLSVVEQFLDIHISYLGCIPSDDLVGTAIRSQRSLLELYPSSAAGRAFTALARRVDEDTAPKRLKGGMQLFFRQLLNNQSELPESKW